MDATRNVKGSAFYHSLVPSRLRTCCASGISLSTPRGIRQVLARVKLVGLSRFSHVTPGQRPLLGGLVRLYRLGVHGACHERASLLPHVTTFVNASGSHRLLYSPAKDQHFVYISIRRPVSYERVSRTRVFTRLGTRLRHKRHC